MFQQVQAKLEEAQITAVRAMDNLDPAIPLGDHTQVDDPDVGQASRDHQPGQALWIRDVALVQVESSALLIGEESLNSEPFGVPVAGFWHQFHVGHQVDGCFVSALPPGDDQHRAVGFVVSSAERLRG